MTSQGVETAIPRHPSNRKFIDQMMLWGWAIGKRGSTWQTMIGPPIGAMKGIKIGVASATQHVANPTSIFLEVYKLTTDGDAEAFWEGPPDPQFWSDTVRQARDRERQRAEAEQLASLQQAAENAQRLAILDRGRERRQTRVEILPPAPPPAPIKERKPRKEEPVPATSNPTIRSSAVFDVLARNDRPMNAMAIVKELGLEQSPLNAKTVNDRCNYLQDKGLADRIMNGVYRASQKGHAIAARIQHDVSNTQTPATAAPPEPKAPNMMPIVDLSRSLITPGVESIDDTIEAVLDLLLPNGFRAADLRFIGPWVEATKLMISQVTRT